MKGNGRGCPSSVYLKVNSVLLYHEINHYLCKLIIPMSVKERIHSLQNIYKYIKFLVGKMSTGWFMS